MLTRLNDIQVQGSTSSIHELMDSLEMSFETIQANEIWLSG